MRVIATRTDDNFGLIEEAEFISRDEQLKLILLEFGMVKPYDDTKPLPPKGLNDYEPGMIYPKDRYVIKDNAMYKSNVETSSSWILSEWTVKITI